MKKCLILVDCDGTLTDGTVNSKGKGRRFSVIDGYVNNILANFSRMYEVSFIIAVVTNSFSSDIEKRCNHLRWEYRPTRDKESLTRSLVKDIDPAYVVAFGDDLPDLGMFRFASLYGTPNKSIIAKKHNDTLEDLYITEAVGGQGAFREFVEGHVLYRMSFTEAIISNTKPSN